MTGSRHSLLSPLLLLLGLLLAAPLSAQQYNFYFPDINKQLPQQFIYALTTDHQGYLWIGTGEGLVKYDGSRLLPVKIGRQNSAVFCTALHAANKQIVAGFYDGTVAIGKDDQLVPLKMVASGKVVAITSIQNNYFIATQSEVLAIENGKLRSVYKTNSSIQGLSANGKSLIIASSSDLIFLDPLTPKPFSYFKGNICNVVSDNARCYFLSDSGLYAVKTAFKSEVLHKLNDGSFLPGNPLSIAGNKLYTAVGNELLEFEMASDRISDLHRFKLNNEELQLRAICAVDGKLWMGTYGNGLSYFNPRTWVSYPSLTKRSEATVALIDVPGLALTEFSASGATLYFHDTDLPQLSNYKKLAISGRPSCAVALDQAHVLVGTEAGKLWNLDLGRVSVYPIASINSKLPGKSILSVNTDRDHIYVSVAFNGVYIFDKSGSLLHHYNTENGLLHNDIFKVFTDREGYQWFVSRSSGLAILQGSEFQYLTLRDGLSSLEFTDITQDKNGVIWLSTEGGGLTSISKGQISNYDLESGLSSDYFYGITSRDSLLYSYSRGSVNILVKNKLRRIDAQELGISPNFSPRAIAAGDHWIAIGSEYGPVILYLQQVFQDNSLKLLVKKVLVNDEKSYPANTDLSYGDFKMEFLVEKINLDPFFQPEVEFMLMGHDKEWQRLDKQSVIYQSVKDNDYQFLVRDSSFPDNNFAFAFSVDKPFWKKPVYYFIGLVAVVVLIYIIFKIRLSQLRERNRELEQKVSERTAELRKKNSELEQFTFAISHDLKNPAINMVELVRLLKVTGNAYDDMTNEVISQLQSVSGKMLHNLMDLIDLLKFANTQELPKEDIDIKDVIENVREAIAQSITEANAKIDVDLSAFSSVNFNRANLHSVFQNLISNAIKYRTPGVDAHIEIRSYLSSGQPFISIKDNGLGMDLEANKDRLFGIFQRMHHHVEGSGIGLHLVKSIMEKHGGDILVKSAPGEGTTFTLVFNRQ